MDFIKSIRHFVGGRIIKTGIAVLITTLICDWLDWPAMFAAITAIVTIEPTAANSIKKAFVRFPATAIGAAYATGLYVGIGDNAFTYALVAIATIVTCHKFHLHDGILVATLTGVAMISTVQDDYISSFFIRLGATSIGLTVSTLVNLLVMKPNYSPAISTKIHDLLLETGNIIEKRGLEMLKTQPRPDKQNSRIMFQRLLKDIERIEELCRYQKEEWKYHRFSRQQMRLFHYEYKKLNVLRQITYHIGNLISIPSQRLSIEKEKAATIMATIQSIKETLYDDQYKMTEKHDDLLDELFEQFWYGKPKPLSNEYKTVNHGFSPVSSIYYELIAINDLLEELNHVQELEYRHQRIFAETVKQV